MTTAIFAFHENGIDTQSALNHFAILESEYAPTIVIKKTAFTELETARWKNIMQKIPQEFPAITYLPYNWNNIKQTEVNHFLSLVKQGDDVLHDYIRQYQFDISPCKDDSPYFYKINKGAPDEYLWLLLAVIAFNSVIIVLPLQFIKKKIGREKLQQAKLPLTIFVCIGLGFMTLEIALFQKLVLYLGSPTISLSILLSSLLVGMGTGSFFGGKIYKNNYRKRLRLVSMLIIVVGAALFILAPYLLNKFLAYNLSYRALISFLLIFPFGYLLGIPFPTSLQILKEEKMEKYIPWMYGINGVMSVLGSVIAVLLSLLFGFTAVFFAGLSLYAVIFLAIALTQKSLQAT